MTLTVFAPYGASAASARVRVLDWLAHTGVAADVHDYAGLSSNTLGQVVRHLPAVAAAEARARRAARVPRERVLVHREVSPFSSGGLVEQVLGRSACSVYDFDDALMWSPGRRRDALWSKAESCVRAVSACDRVIAGSDVLADWALTHARDVRMIPTCIQPEAYVPKADYALGDPPRLVWLGSPSTERYLGGVASALLEVHARTGARLTLISAGAALLGPLDRMVDRLAWRPGVEAQLGRFDVAIAPLDDAPWERGKCAYKVLQYAAAGLPVVVSPVGANRTAAGQLGLSAARSAPEWVDAVMALLGAAPVDRRTVGATARREVGRYYSFAAWSAEWLAAVGEPMPGSRSAESRPVGRERP